MSTPAEADAQKDPVNQITDWSKYKQDLEHRFKTKPPAIQLDYLAGVRLTDFTLTIPLKAPDFVSCSNTCDAASGKIMHIHSGVKTFSFSQNEAEEFARRTLKRIETFFQSSAGGSAAGIKWDVKGQVKTKDEVIEEIKLSISTSISAQSTFVLKDPQDSAPVCGETKRYFGAFMNVTFHGRIVVIRQFDYEPTSGTVTWRPGFRIRPDGDVSINVDTTVDWYPAKFNWTKVKDCDPCDHAMLFKDELDGGSYFVQLYDHFDGTMTEGDLPPDKVGWAMLPPLHHPAGHVGGGGPVG
jgi:hypothetical protein